MPAPLRVVLTPGGMITAPPAGSHLGLGLGEGVGVGQLTGVTTTRLAAKGGRSGWCLHHFAWHIDGLLWLLTVLDEPRAGRRRAARKTKSS